MKLLSRIGCLFSCLLASACASTPRPQAAEPATLAIVGADVLPMTGPERLRDQTVLISGDRIVRVGPRRKVAVPAGAQRIDASGMTLMPGLVDMHVHVANAPGAEGDAAHRALAVMLGHGITTARGMAGSANNLVVRDAIERGEIAGPRLYAAAPGISDNNVKTVEAARAAIRKAKENGFDLIKSHHITNVEVWSAVQDEAKEQGLPTAGHVTNQIGLGRAMAAGQQVEHLDGTFFELLPEGSPERSIDFAQIPPQPVIDAVSRVPSSAVQALAVRTAAARSFQVPTLGLFEKLASPSKAELFLRDPEMRFVSPKTLQLWAQQHDGLKEAGFTGPTAQMFSDIRRRIVRAYRDAGVAIMAGSDTPQAFHIGGPGLLQEIEALNRAGLTAMESLRAATIVPRDYFRSLPNGGSSLGWKADFGTVTEGARADLILLSDDPSRDLAALRTLRTVIARGKVYDRAALDQMLSAAAEAAARN